MVYFQVVGTPCLHSLPWKSLISFSNDVHLKEKTLKTFEKSYISLWKSAISKMFASQLSDWE